MLGQSEDSNFEFTICSEKAGLERIKGDEAKQLTEAKQKVAAA
jgi:hypothetical protein